MSYTKIKDIGPSVLSTQTGAPSFSSILLEDDYDYIRNFYRNYGSIQSDLPLWYKIDHFIS